MEEKGFNGIYQSGKFFETNVLLRKHNTAECINLMNHWWEWIEKNSKRDQLSLTYVLWKNSVNVNYLFEEKNLRNVDFLRVDGEHQMKLGYFQRKIYYQKIKFRQLLARIIL